MNVTQLKKWWAIKGQKILSCAHQHQTPDFCEDLVNAFVHIP